MRETVIGLMLTTIAVSVPVPSGAVEISDVRLAFEMAEQGIFTRELIVIKGDASTPVADTSVTLPLPKGATGAELSEEHDTTGLALTGKGVIVTGAIPPDGRTVALMFTLPIDDGKAVLDQQLGTAVGLAHAAFVGDNEAIQMTGPGFGKTEANRIPSGLPALFTAGRNFSDGHLRLTVTGFDSNIMTLFSKLATLLSFGILAVGFIIWLRRR